MRFRIINRYSGEWLEWDGLHPKARSIDASAQFLLFKPLNQRERDDFGAMLEDGETERLSPGGQFLYRIVH